MQTIILGGGHLGSAIATAASARGERIPIIGRPSPGPHDPVTLERADVLIDATRADAVADDIASGLDAGIRRFVIATTGWAIDRDAVERQLLDRAATAVVAANFSLGVALFARIVERATELLGSAAEYDPYLVEWHRRAKPDRPSGTALDLARRIVARHPRLHDPGDLETVSVRAGASPGMHLVGFDAPGETIELRLTARDRSAYASGVLAATDWLRRAPRAPGIHPFDPVVDELLDTQRSAA
jgi:4-hydroxy-tetrahydrodipicolinate reductase